jgi:hypothetical protein
MNNCEICDSEKVVHFVKKAQMYLCDRHRTQLNKYGRILERSRSDKNEIIIYNNYAEIIIYNYKNEEKCKAIIDLEDVKKCSKYKWGMDGKYVITRFSDGSYIYLHNFIMNFNKEGLFLDHIDINPLNNRKDNFRECTNQQNCFNQGMQKNNTSGVKGVWWDKRNNKWKAEIKINYKKISLGAFDNLTDAAKARDEAERKYFGEFNPNKHKNVGDNV